MFMPISYYKKSLSSSLEPEQQLPLLKLATQPGIRIETLHYGMSVVACSCLSVFFFLCVCASVCVTLFRDWTLSQRRDGPKPPELGKRPTKIRRLSTIKGQDLSCVFLPIPVMTLTLCRFLSLANRNHPAMHKCVLIAVIFHICCVPVLFRVCDTGPGNAAG